MSADLLRQAVEVERAEWGSEESRRTYPTSSAIHLALARWLEDLAAGWPWDDEEPGVVDWDGDRLTLDESLDSHALAIARLIVGGAS